MRRHGYTMKGTARWYCPQCRVSAVWLRPDVCERHERRRFVRWLTGKASVSELAAGRSITRQAASKRFASHFQTKMSWRVPRTIRILVLDGTFIHGRALVALIARTEQGEVCWQFAPYEAAETWNTLIRHLPRPSLVVCDGQKGLLKQINASWPGVAIQRCHFHILKLARRHLTRHPKTEAGRTIKALLHTLPEVRTLRAAQAWRKAYKDWEKQYEKFLSERTRYHDGVRSRWWYTHRNLRGVRSLIQGALPHLFAYLRYPGAPNTTNHVEGGINALIAEALRLHRGLRFHQKKTLVSLLLAEMNRRKNATRKFT